MSRRTTAFIFSSVLLLALVSCGRSKCESECEIDPPPQVIEQVTGVILALGLQSIILAPDADTVCGITTSQLFVTLTDDVVLFTVTITDFGSVITLGGSLKAGLTIGMNGSCESEGYITDNAVIVDDQRD